MNTINTILKRQSCRNFKDEQVSKEQIEQILIAANASPVGMAKYECFNITVIQNKELLNKLEENAVNYMPQNPNKHPLYNAPTAILISMKKDTSTMASMYVQSAGCIMENILLASTELGLGSVYLMAVPNFLGLNAELCEEVGIEEGFIPVAMAGIGYSNNKIESKVPTTNKIKTSFID